MAISEEDVRHIGRLARLSLTEDQVGWLGHDLNSILDHIGAIQQLELSGVEPTAHALDVVNSTRDDVVRPGLDRDAALRNAPAEEDGAFVIPRIVGGGDDA